MSLKVKSFDIKIQRESNNTKEVVAVNFSLKKLIRKVWFINTSLTIITAIALSSMWSLTKYNANALLRNFNIVQMGKTKNLMLIQDKENKGFYIYDEDFIRPLDNSRQEGNISDATTPIDIKEESTKEKIKTTGDTNVEK